jgi:hypothetical protein
MDPATASSLVTKFWAIQQRRAPKNGDNINLMFFKWRRILRRFQNINLYPNKKMQLKMLFQNKDFCLYT